MISRRQVFGTGVYLVPLRHPTPVAKQVSILDHLTEGRFFRFNGVTMQPPPRQAGSAPIWCGGRSDAALRRIGRMTDGWMSYVITPEMFRHGLEKITAAAAKAGRAFHRGFGTAHLPFTCIDDTYEKVLDAATVSPS